MKKLLRISSKCIKIGFKPEEIFNIIRNFKFPLVVEDGFDLAEVSQRLNHLLLGDLAGTVLVVQNVTSTKSLIPAQLSMELVLQFSRKTKRCFKLFYLLKFSSMVKRKIINSGKSILPSPSLSIN